MSRRAFAILVASFFTLFVAFAVRYAYGLLLPHMLSSLAINKTQAGFIYSSYFLAYTIFSPILGLLVDRYDARAILTAFVAVLGAGACLMSLSVGVTQASLFFALAGLGHSACWVPVVTVVQRWVSDRRRGTALAVVDLGSASGIAAWSALMPLIVGAYDWRAGWMALGLLALIAACLNFLLVRSHPPARAGSPMPVDPRAERTPVREIYGALLRDRRFWLIGLSYMLIAFSILIPYAFLATYANQELSISYKSAAGLIGIIAVAGVFGKLVLGYISDRVGRIRVMMLCGVFTAVGGLGMALGQGFSLLVLSTAVFGVGYGAIWALYAASARDFFPVEQTGSVIGLWTLYLGIGSILSPVLAGWIIDSTGGYRGAFFLVTLSGVLASLLLLPVLGEKASRRKY
jgi:predicted MFS family arabinose efflux permease